MRIPLTILGGGAAGLAVGYFASKHGLQSELYEAGPQIGGLCRTFSCGEFRFDAGAHQLHNTDSEITREVDRLLGGELTRIEARSAVYLAGRFVPLPPSIPSLMKHVGPLRLAWRAVQGAAGRLRRRPSSANLAARTTRQYGAELASPLLSYCEKLWGVDPGRLLADPSCYQLSTFSLASAFGLAGTGDELARFRYPTVGFDKIPQRFAAAAPGMAVHVNASASRIVHRNGRITHVRIDGQLQPVDRTVCSLPLGVTAQLFDPPLDEEVLQAARAIRFRHLTLVAILIDKPMVSPFASVYFPDRRFPFTRVSEPRNRSLAMAPPGKTSVLAEIPHDAPERVARSPAIEAAAVVRNLSEIGLLSGRQVLGFEVKQIPNAYPVRDLVNDQAAKLVIRALGRFQGFDLVGRSGLFTPSYLHEVLRSAKRLADDVHRSTS